MEGMNLKQFKETMINFDEIEFTYCGITYDFQKENVCEGKIKISIWQCGDNPKCIYSVEVEDDVKHISEIVKKLINAKIFFDGKSIIDGEADIDVEFFT